MSSGSNCRNSLTGGEGLALSDEKVARMGATGESSIGVLDYYHLSTSAV